MASGTGETMRTKEIEVWVDHKMLTDYESGITRFFGFKKPQDEKQLRITFTLEVPDRKIEISESQFDQAWLKAVGTTYDKDLIDLKKELFGE